MTQTIKTHHEDKYYIHTTNVTNKYFHCSFCLKPFEKHAHIHVVQYFNDDDNWCMLHADCKKDYLVEREAGKDD